jgi:hypothetical protein
MQDHPGLEMGRRHDPLVAAFMNGTVTGKDVFIPMKSIIGGQERCGFGWNMPMDCLAEGRSVSLPASKNKKLLPYVFLSIDTTTTTTTNTNGILSNVDKLFLS